jgi:hypothetical protein
MAAKCECSFPKTKALQFVAADERSTHNDVFAELLQRIPLVVKFKSLTPKEQKAKLPRFLLSIRLTVTSKPLSYSILHTRCFDFSLLALSYALLIETQVHTKRNIRPIGCSYCWYVGVIGVHVVLNDSRRAHLQLLCCFACRKRAGRLQWHNLCGQ